MVIFLAWPVDRRDPLLNGYRSLLGGPANLPGIEHTRPGTVQGQVPSLESGEYEGYPYPTRNDLDTENFSPFERKEFYPVYKPYLLKSQMSSRPVRYAGRSNVQISGWKVGQTDPGKLCAGAVSCYTFSLKYENCFKSYER